MRISRLLLIALLLFAFAIRVYGLNWDQNQHLHPDERFLTMVAVAQKFPTSVAQYFDPQTSKLNPTNVGFPFYVYGTFPVTITHYIAAIFGKADYFNLTLVGRGISALCDVGIVFFVYAIAALFEKKYRWHPWIKYAAAFVYAIMVLPIQNAHFFTVDSFVTFFMIGSLYFALRAYNTNHVTQNTHACVTWYMLHVLCGVFLGLALASKINALYIIPLLIALLFLPLLSSRGFRYSGRREIPGKLLATLLMIITTYLTLHLADPYFFASSNFFDLRPNPAFLANLAQLRTLSTPDVWFPPGVQWITKIKLLFPLQNIIFFGMGPILFLASIAGLVLLFKKLRSFELTMVYGWALIFFLYQGIQFGMPMRYFYILYPLLAIPAGYFLAKTILTNSRLIQLTLTSLILIWPLMFLSIYSRPHSRVTASKWIYEHIPAGAVLAQEHWDDSLPLSFSDKNSSQYTIIQMPVFGPDDGAKWKEIQDDLQKADYIIFTSNRGYGSIGTVPQRYPRMSKWYGDLFAGKLAFKKIQEFTSYPQLVVVLQSRIPLCGRCWKLEIPDGWSEESFTVYDHPQVTVFKKV